MTQRQPVAESAAVVARASERRGQDVEPLVEFEPADAEQHRLSRRDAVPLPHDRAFGWSGERSRFDQIDAVRDRPHLAGARLQMPRDRGFERHVGRDDAVGGARAAPDGPAQRHVAEALEPRLRRRRRAELLEPCGFSTSGARPAVAEAPPGWRRARSRRSRPSTLAPNPWTTSTSSAGDQRRGQTRRRASRTADTPCCDRGSSCRGGSRTGT